MNFLQFVLMCNACVPLLVAIMFAMSGMWAFATAFFLLSLIGDGIWLQYEMEVNND